VDSGISAPELIELSEWRLEIDSVIVTSRVVVKSGVQDVQNGQAAGG
jgi:hypothetical protein